MHFGIGVRVGEEGELGEREAAFEI